MAGDLPVLAAGGIGHGAQIAAPLTMGAQGVWMGTSWLLTVEHARGDHVIGDQLREKLFAAGSSDTRQQRQASTADPVRLDRGMGVPRGPGTAEDAVSARTGRRPHYRH